MIMIYPLEKMESDLVDENQVYDGEADSTKDIFDSHFAHESRNNLHDG